MDQDNKHANGNNGQTGADRPQTGETPQQRAAREDAQREIAQQHAALDSVQFETLPQNATPEDMQSEGLRQGVTLEDEQIEAPQLDAVLNDEQIDIPQQNIVLDDVQHETTPTKISQQHIASERQQGSTQRERVKREETPQQRAAREDAQRERVKREEALQQRAAREDAQRERPQRERIQREQTPQQCAAHEDTQRSNKQNEKTQREQAPQQRAAREDVQRVNLQRENTKREETPQKSITKGDAQREIASQREQGNRALPRKHKEPTPFRRAWWKARPAVVLILSIALCAAVFYVAYDYLAQRLFAPVDINDATPIEITVPTGYGASGIARILYEAGGTDEDGNLLDTGVISSKTVFKIYVDFTGKSDKLQAGTYVVSRNMDIEQIVDVLCKGNPPRQTVRFTITEGLTVEEIANKLVALEVFETPDEFLALCKTGEEFTDTYSFINDIKKNPLQQRDYVLEGYLFPDTYEIYADEKPKSIINRMLYRFFEIFTDDYRTRALELNMNIDDIVTLASVIEKEAKVESDFSKVSAVFHTRMEIGMKLESDAPLRYVFKRNTLSFTTEELQNTSLYNTYVHEGLPLGPIANPGKRAIEAALYPNEEFMKMDDKYIFFCLMDVESGALVYAKTLDEHQENVAKYSPDW